MNVINIDPTRGGDEIPEENSAHVGIRVILADSQAIYRVGMKKVFALEDDIRVVAQVETLTNLYASLQRYPTDVVVLEGQLIAGTIDAIPELIRQHRSEADRSGQRGRRANTVELYRRGVRGVVPHSISPDLLIKLRKIAEGKTWIDNQSISWVTSLRARPSSHHPRVSDFRRSYHQLHHPRNAQKKSLSDQPRSRCRNLSGSSTS
jgi:DNA-binding NarL/FixJ family response regulator